MRKKTRSGKGAFPEKHRTEERWNSVKSNDRIAKANKILNLLIAVTAALVVILAVILGIRNFIDSRTMDLSYRYQTDKYLSGNPLKEASSALAPAFADELCVGQANVPLGDIAFAEREKAGLFQLDSGEILYAQGIYDKIYPASITKIMTALLAIEYGNMEDVVTIQAEDVNLEEGSVLSGMQAGDQVTMDQLFYTLVVYSANDAGMAIARHIGGTVEEFVNLMNQEAQNLGMTGTHFVNPHGLHDDNHYTTVYDIYLMLNRAFSEQKYTEAMSMESYTLTVTAADGTQRTRYLTATDQYLTGAQTAPENVTVLGGKTGTTSKAGSCLALVSQNAYGEPFISIVVNAANKTDLYNDMNTLLSQIN